MTDKYVCAKCITDYAIKDFIKNNIQENFCNYCGRESKRLIAAPFELVAEFIKEGIDLEYTSNTYDAGGSWDKEDGKWFGDIPESTDEFVRYKLNADNDITENEEFLEDLIGFLGWGEVWCEHDYAMGQPSEALVASWDHFSEQVKHNTRYMFFRNHEKDEYGDPRGISPHEMLDTLAKIVEETGLIHKIPENKVIYRVRLSDENTLIEFKNSNELGTIPIAKAKSHNRMSPAGISMFYGAFDSSTAIKEVYRDNSIRLASIGKFRVLKPMPVLDLTSLNSTPSLFDPDRNRKRNSFRFLQSFCNEVRRPIPKDGREHIEYIPTQVFTEYFRHVYRNYEGKNLQGIIYPSAAREGHKSCVLFVENNECCDKDCNNLENKWLMLEEVSYSNLPNENYP